MICLKRFHLYSFNSQTPFSGIYFCPLKSFCETVLILSVCISDRIVREHFNLTAENALEVGRVGTSNLEGLD